MSMNLSVTARLGIIKNLLAVFLIATVAFTWPLWSADRAWPLFPGTQALSSLHEIVSYALPVLFILSLLLTFTLRSPRLFIFLSLLCGSALLLLDAGRLHYWFYFYLLVLSVLLGYNWRVDNAHHFYASFNALRILAALLYLFAAVQHLGADFITVQWPAFIKPFERFWTPEQCAYLLKLAYAIPIIELFIVAGLFFNATKITAISFAALFHLFTMVVLLLQPAAEPAVILWNLFMILFVCALFAGRPAGQKSPGFALSFYPLAVLLLFACAAPGYYFTHGKPLENKVDLMQANQQQQFIYISAADKNKLPLYVQSFALAGESGYHMLNVTGWCLHELKTRQVLSPEYLMRLSVNLNANFGVDGMVIIPPAASVGSAIALK